MMKSNDAAALRERYEAFQSARGVVELKNWSSVALTGVDRQAFLHNFCTNDVKRLSPGERCEAFFTNVKGKIFGHGLVTCRETELVVIGEPGQATSLIAHLDRYILREDVQLHDETNARCYLLVDGRKFSADSFGTAVHIDNWYEVPGRAFHVIETSAADVRDVKDKLVAGGLVICDEVFEIARIEARIPLFGVDFDERNLPQEVGRSDQAISFTKGCYLGQETVARIDALGHVNQQLVGVRFTGDVVPEKGCELVHAGKTAGHVSSAAFSPKLDAPLALAMVRREQSHVGTRLDSRVGPCEVVALPA
jgi:folate-binding protein YgfZ